MNATSLRFIRKSPGDGDNWTPRLCGFVLLETLAHRFKQWPDRFKGKHFARLTHKSGQKHRQSTFVRADIKADIAWPKELGIDFILDRVRRGFDIHFGRQTCWLRRGGGLTRRGRFAKKALKKRRTHRWPVGLYSCFK